MPQAKLMSARASLRAALQSPQAKAFPSANNPDSMKFGSTKKKMPKAGKNPSLSMALTGQF